MTRRGAAAGTVVVLFNRDLRVHDHPALAAAAGAAHFIRWLCDGDIASNSGNWQWVAGTGNDTRPNRGFNVDRQAARFDPDGDYVRRWTRG